MQSEYRYNSNGCLEEWIVESGNIIEPWGFETADSYSFFSQETGGFRNKILKKEVNVSASLNQSRYEVEMAEGKWDLEIDEKIEGQKIFRRHRITLLEDSFLMDYVSRFRFKKKYFNTAVIGGREIKHRKTNLYHQYPVKEALLCGDQFEAKIKVNSSLNTDKFRQYLYVRDYEDVWVVHARLLPDNWDKEVIKICRKWYNKAIPQKISDLLLKSKQIRNYLWYRGETREPNFPVNAFPMVKLSAGTIIELSTEAELIDKKLI